MTLHFNLFFVIFLYTVSTVLLASYTAQRPITCPKVPAVPVDLKAYQGRWYNIATNPESYRRTLRPDDGGSCVTANYTLTPSNTVDVLNCLYLRKKDRVSCVQGILRTTNLPGVFQVKLQPSRVFAPYGVVGLFGRREDGYTTALVYSCQEIPEKGVQQALFVLSRTPKLKFGKSELWYYLKVYEQLGVRLPRGMSLEDIIFFPQKECKYFDD